MRSSVAAAAVLSCLLSAAVAAQNSEVLSVKGPQPRLVALGGSTRVDIVVENSLGQVGVPRLPPVEGLRYQASGPSTSQQMSFVGGRQTVQRSVSYSFEIIPSKVGRYEIPAFDLVTGRKTQRVGPIVFDVEKDVSGAERAFLDVSTAVDAVYVGEPLRFVFDYGIDARLSPVRRTARNGESYYDIRIDAPWFDSPEGAVRIDAEAVDKNANVNLVVNEALQSVVYAKDPEGPPEIGAVQRFSFVRSYMPTEPGSIEIPMPTLKFTVETSGGQRDFFGRRSGGTKTLFAYGEPMRVTVKPIPDAARPESYTNGVGRFALEANVSPRRLKVGDSLKLELAIRGQGNLEYLDPPELPELDGFHFLGQNIQREADAVIVTYDLRPLRDDIEQVPSVAWSSFDTTPGVEAFVELATAAQPITVEPAAAGGGLATLPGEDDAAVVAGVDDIFGVVTVPDADAAPLLPVRRIERPWFVGLLALAPWLLCLGLAFGLRARRSRNADVRGRRASGALRRFRSRIGTEDPVDALTGYVADRLGVEDAAVIGPDLSERLGRAGVDAGVASEVQAAIDAGTAARYGGGAALDAATARSLVEALEGQALSPPKAAAGVGAGGAAVLAITLSLLASAPASAQQGSGGGPASAQTADGYSAYQAGDYSRAAELFARALEAPGADRRLAYSLGNAQFRAGAYAQALVAYERARLAMPRDDELLANIALCERRLDLAGSAGREDSFAASLVALRQRFSGVERCWIAVILNLIAAGCVVFGGRAVRWIGVVLAVPALLLVLDIVWLAPNEPVLAIVTAPRVGVVAEPREGLEPVLELRQGVRVDWLGESADWASVRAAGRRGYLPRSAIGVVR